MKMTVNERDEVKAYFSAMEQIANSGSAGQNSVCLTVPTGHSITFCGIPEIGYSKAVQAKS
jgi:hypothetical protein